MADLVSTLFLDDMQGAKSGPFRWVFLRRILRAVWEWKSFQALPWQNAFMAAFAEKINVEFSDDKV